LIVSVHRRLSDTGRIGLLRIKGKPVRDPIQVSSDHILHGGIGTDCHYGRMIGVDVDAKVDSIAKGWHRPLHLHLRHYIRPPRCIGGGG
jgi:hypothetical protein